MNRGAFFCDETVRYRCPEEPDAKDLVTLRFRTAKDEAEHVYLVCHHEKVKRELLIKRTEGRFDFYETVLRVPDFSIRFYFEITAGRDVCTFNRLGVSTDLRPENSFCMIPGFRVPAWAKGALMYQIFVDRFCNGDPENDVETGEYLYIGSPVRRVENWSEELAVPDVYRFYGGDLQGILDKLDYLQSLKVEVIYLSPVFVSPSNHKYDCQDYEHIDPHYGSIVRDCGELLDSATGDNSHSKKYAVRTADKANLEASDALFVRLVEAIHARGMRVILDGVFNHCGSFNKWLDRERIYEQEGSYEPGAYLSADSPYRSFFRFRDEEYWRWPNNDSYEGWWDHDTLPKLNYEGSRGLYQYILDIARKWLSPPYCIDGWRLDVAADLGHSPEMNHKFWQDFRRVVKAVNPEALILAEHYGDVQPWLQGNEWDTVMNYDAFMEPVSWFLTGMEKHSDAKNDHLHHNSQAFFGFMMGGMSRMPEASLLSAMNELSNHDHSRFLTRTNGTRGRLESMGTAAASMGINYGIFYAAVVIQMTWPGAPTIYYGDETGLCGWTDPDSRRTYPWGREDWEIVELHKYLSGIRNRNRAFRTGSFKALNAENGVIAYGRFNEAERGVVIVNSEGHGRRVRVPVWQAEVAGPCMYRIMETGEKRYNVGKLAYPVEDGMMTVEVGPYSAMIFEEKLME
ncbi:MAG: glycoside hydrolase family 13 protein [Lachnospiraceae bacterium]|nr:glycoside hydrolase family 13 protein [Lachnospiraceae bacterium]